MDYFSGLYQAGRRFREKSRQNATQTAGRQERRSPEPGCQVVSPVQNALTVFFYLYSQNRPFGPPLLAPAPLGILIYTQSISERIALKLD